jgi:hypothetical protein
MTAPAAATATSRARCFARRRRDPRVVPSRHAPDGRDEDEEAVMRRYESGGRMDPVFGWVSAAQRREAELFFAELMGRSPRRLRDGGAPAESTDLAEQAAPFQIEVKDPAEITAQARESKYRWQGDQAQIELAGGGVEVGRQVSSNGLFEIPSGAAAQASLSTVYRGGTSRSYLRWRLAKGGPPATFQTGAPHTVEISTRLRLSLWSFVPPLTTDRVTSTSVELDSAQVSLLREADVDDLSLVWTVTWDRRERDSDPAKPPKWHDGFVVRGQAGEAHRRNYLAALIAALHPKVQVIVGFEIVRATPRKDKTPPATEDEKRAAAKDAALGAVATDFAKWLEKATPDDIKNYARSIAAFFFSRGLDIDGVGYDFEFDQLTARHRDNLALLYRETSSAIAHRNGIVSYANAPFQQDGVSSNGFMQAQPYAIAASGLNLLARPMCFDGTSSTSLSGIEASIACALRSPGDTTKPGGAGLHPSQVQFGIWADKVPGGVEELCRRLLRPNRIGLLVYNLPPVEPRASAMLRKCKTWNALLNPNEGPAGQEAQPLQVPRGAGGWPPPFQVTT